MISEDDTEIKVDQEWRYQDLIVAVHMDKARILGSGQIGSGDNGTRQTGRTQDGGLDATSCKTAQSR